MRRKGWLFISIEFAPISYGQRSYLVAFQILLITILLSSCALRSVDADYYIGPVIYRYNAPPKGGAYVNQLMRFGIAAEAGTSWGVTLGMLERVTVIPLTTKSSDSTDINVLQVMPWSLFTVPLAKDWKLSLFYLSMERHADDYFLYRSVYGAEIMVGKEINNLSFGAVRRTIFKPPDNTFSSLHFESNHPMQTQARIWIDDQSDNISPELLEELTK